MKEIRSNTEQRVSRIGVILVLASVLFVSQWFSQIHALGHLGDADQGEYDAQTCVLCILGVNLDHLATGVATQISVEACVDSLEALVLLFSNQRVSLAYQQRAPPRYSPAT